MIKIELNIPYSDILEVKHSNKRGIFKLVIYLKNGNIITLYGDQAKNISKKLIRNKAGEQLE